jgi:hypothetical protein
VNGEGGSAYLSSGSSRHSIISRTRVLDAERERAERAKGERERGERERGGRRREVEGEEGERGGGSEEARQARRQRSRKAEGGVSRRERLVPP